MNGSIEKIENILKSEYSTQRFVEFVVEVFDSIKIVAPEKFHKEFSNFSSHIEGYSHIGDYVTPDGKKIAVFSVQLKTASYVENSRSTQRSYVRRLIDAGNCDASIVAFYSSNDTKWRLSFVRLDYEMKFDNGKFRSTENLTPAKRYSFLVGKDEPCHTAISRFYSFIIDKNYNPSLDEIEEAFSVEKVTKEFFDLYCEKYYQVQEYLDQNQDFIDESRRCGFTSEQFAKKLMGQIVFLYFLQKKGWLGVGVWPATINEKEYKNVFFTGGAQGRIIKEILPNLYIHVAENEYKLNSKYLDDIPDDAEEIIANHMPITKTWGDGSRKFLRTIFEWSQKHEGHFYEKYLEPLFYNTLNRNRGPLGYCPELHCRVPFLSGGLFDPIDNYDWKLNNFDIPDEVFSNKKSNSDREGTGILDIFDRYNFTISEDEPMEREVAIDPEMLGKVFENLLEVKDRKSKGAFYTPREIVHYMCQESLIHFLTSKTGLEEDDVRDFILYGDFMKDEDTTKEKREGNNAMYISDKIFKVDNSGNVVVNRLYEIDNALANVRIADPAVGSGAFPLGMMNEIVRARQNITAYLNIGKSSYEKRTILLNDRSPYSLKRDTIKNSIFAVDVEPSAVDIARLRLWLSLVIDDEINPNAQNELEGHRNPLPLPNLECNILCGNSLVDRLMGVELVKESSIIGTLREGTQIDFEQEAFDIVLQKLLNEQDALFYCDDLVKKEEIKKNIQSYKDLIVSEQLKWTNTDAKRAYELSKTQPSKPFVLWQLDFARVFRDNGGFDIVIGNPPYIGERKHKDVFYEVQNSSLGKYYLGRMDYFYFFFHLSLNILKEKGICSLITTNYFTTALGGKKLRDDLKERSDIVEMINFNECKVFETALGQHNMITTIQKGHHNKVAKTVIVNLECPITTQEVNKVLRNGWKTTVHHLKQEDLYDGNENYLRLIGTEKNGDPINSILNKIVDSATDTLGNICNPLIGLESSLDEVYVLPKAKINEITNGSVEEMKYVKEFYKGSQIHRYFVEDHSDKYILYLHERIDNIQSLEGIWKYLLQHEKEIKSRKGANLRGAFRRGNWWVLNTPRLDMNFADEKIVTHYRSKSLRFALSTTPWYASRDVYYIVKQKQNVSLKYVLALLNSSLYYLWFYHRGKRKGDTLELYAKPLKETPIRELPVDEQLPFISIVDEIITRKKNQLETGDLEHQIDMMVYNIYGLSQEEIELIESSEYKYGKE